MGNPAVRSSCSRAPSASGTHSSALAVSSPLWSPAEPGAQEALVGSEPTRFFKPPTSASGTFSDWLGVFLDHAAVDWDEIAEIVEDAFRLVAPATAVAELDRK